ncbi:MAG: hypothetical protein IT429_25420 [Gemmataceae bacterium]|nr:hypothetical protein [Gemmataceae bacterium]
MNRDDFTFRAPRQAVRACTVLAAIGAVAVAAGLAVAPTETWASLLLVSYALVGLSLGSAVLIALQYVTGAGWGVALRRVPEAMALALPVGAVGILLVLVCAPSLYPWTSHTDAHTGHVSELKHLWLSRPFFLVRAVVYLACWYAFILALVRNSRRQDRDGAVSHTRRNVALSAAFLVVFGVTCWLASYDWVMSLEPEWYSTIFGLYAFAGLFLGGLAALTLLVLWLRRAGPLRRVVSVDHLHDLGKLVFAFSTFWVYIWFCQYMLIWYVNNPEETAYYIRRQDGAWQSLLVLSVVLNWGVPFLALLSRAAKRNAVWLGRVCAVVLLGQWLDLYVLIGPPFGQPTVQELALQAVLLLGAGGVFCLAVFRALGQAPLVPVGDPFLVESLPASSTAFAGRLAHNPGEDVCFPVTHEGRGGQQIGQAHPDRV